MRKVWKFIWYPNLWVKSFYFHLKKKICWLSLGCHIHSCFSYTFETTAHGSWVTTELLASVHVSLTQIVAGWGSGLNLGGIPNSLQRQLWTFLCVQALSLWLQEGYSFQRSWLGVILVKNFPQSFAVRSRQMCCAICFQRGLLSKLIIWWADYDGFHEDPSHSYIIHCASLLKCFVGCRIQSSTTW